MKDGNVASVTRLGLTQGSGGGVGFAAMADMLASDSMAPRVAAKVAPTECLFIAEFSLLACSFPIAFSMLVAAPLALFRPA
jgi:hypothetical protein